MSYNSFVYNIGYCPPAIIDSGVAMVEFRLLSGYDGEFGFDWYRKDDEGKHAYKAIALSSLEEIGREYPQFQMIVKYTMTYHVPYLTLFAPETVQREAQGEYKAELAMRITTFEEVEKIVFEYDKDLLRVELGGKEGDVLTAEEIKMVEAGQKTYTICIECLDKGDGFDDAQEIKVWAYPKQGKRNLPEVVATAKKKTDSNQGNTQQNANANTVYQERMLAGKILLPANSKRCRRQIDVAIVKVKTNIENSKNGAKEPDGSSEKELARLKKTLNQCLTLVNIETDIKTLDLTQNNDFKIRKDKQGKERYGRFVYHKFVDKVKHPEKTTDRTLAQNKPGFYEELQRLFLSVKGNKKYANHYLVFYFADMVYTSYITSDAEYKKTTGQVQGLNTKSVALFKDHDEYDLSHEMLHCFGVLHPFSKDAKHQFRKYLTDNVADYTVPQKKGQKPDTTKISTWVWQWRQVNFKLNIKVVEKNAKLEEHSP